jgi:hypothetical protein
MITKEVIVEEQEVEILRGFMKKQAGRVLDIRTIEGALIWGILYQITTEDKDDTKDKRHS